MCTANRLNKYSLLLLLSIVTALSGCGAAHVRTDMESADIHQYEKLFISEVKVHSQEAAAAENEDLQSKMREWELFARSELESYVNDSHYQLLTEAPGPIDKALIANLDIDMAYGSRALRYWVGFGAGKGRVNSVLTVTDSVTGEKKFVATAESDLSMGGAGGSMEKVLKTNVSKLVEQYPSAPGTDQ